MKNSKAYTAFVHTVFILMTIGFALPFLIILAVSFSNEKDIADFGFSMIPRRLDFTAYSMLFQSFDVIGRSILLTVFVAVAEPLGSCIVNSLMAYALTSEDYRLRKLWMWFLILTMVVSGGKIPTYVVYTQMYGFGNNILVYLLPGLTSTWGIILFRTFFKSLSPSLLESARIDGANQLQVLFRIVFPMSKAIFAIQYFLDMIGKWNNFETSLLYMTDEKLFTIQHVLQRILENASILKQAFVQFGLTMDIDIPVMTLRYAICIIAMLPIFVVFPYVQKHFSKGMTVGSVKG